MNTCFIMCEICNYCLSLSISSLLYYRIRIRYNMKKFDQKITLLIIPSHPNILVICVILWYIAYFLLSTNCFRKNQFTINILRENGRLSVLSYPILSFTVSYPILSFTVSYPLGIVYPNPPVSYLYYNAVLLVRIPFSWREDGYLFLCRVLLTMVYFLSNYRGY